MSAVQGSRLVARLAVGASASLSVAARWIEECSKETARLARSSARQLAVVTGPPVRGPARQLAVVTGPPVRGPFPHRPGSGPYAHQPPAAGPQHGRLRWSAAARGEYHDTPGHVASAIRRHAWHAWHAEHAQQGINPREHLSPQTPSACPLPRHDRAGPPAAAGGRALIALSRDGDHRSAGYVLLTVAKAHVKR
ncbi:hypothetical protein GCM10010299_54850 [Streptomyces tanashiensis]|nr:hypothetical protein GCM10010299_54850 [Streptomyces tanashiensis]